MIFFQIFGLLRLLNLIALKFLKTDIGFLEGKRLIRYHRLWETFLVNVLGCSWDEVHHEAETLEHACSDDLINRIDAYLNFPRVDPHGNPIPDKDGTIKTSDNEQSLSTIPINQKVTVKRFVSFDSQYLKYISDRGLVIGSELTVCEKLEFDDSLLCKVNEEAITVSALSAKHIFVVKV